MPYLKEHFGIFSAHFQWLDIPESETLVFTKYQKYQKTKSTKKPEAPVQKSANQVWRGKSWIFLDPNTPDYSRQRSAPPDKEKHQKDTIRAKRIIAD